MEDVRRQGERSPEGYIRNRIEELIFDYPDGIETPKIKEWLRESEGIRERKVLDYHLKKLEKKGRIIKIPPIKLGRENKWKPNLNALEEMVKERLHSNDNYQLTNIKSVKNLISSRINELRDFDPDFDPELVWVLQEAAQVSPMVARLLLEGELNTDHLKETYEKIEIHFREEYLGIGDNVLLKIIVACILQDYLTGSEETKQRIKNNCELELTCSP